MKELDVKKEEVVQEILEKIVQQKYFIAKGDQGDYWINTSLIRYIRVLQENSGLNINLINQKYVSDKSFLFSSNFD